ncbi:nucleotidyltransferase family protein [Dechloromonas sp. A34]|uniref:nucleotidyltransferase domain-containing protein n=1 Tax=Dechloromonas sp. A34 TaxID=447588 RepID=UPI00224996F8|nr:nucleotidyltransferase family protein [Dechloromonas sp. A34]
MIKNHPLIRFLRSPHAALKDLSATDWDLLIRTARRGYLLSRVAHLARQADLLSALPKKVIPHISSALRVAESQYRSVAWEITQIQHTLHPHNIPFVVLKGGAYIITGHDAGNGRVLSDIDIMVPHKMILEAERALVGNGWFPGKLDAYDQRYYRTWMHELPPLRHLGRGTTLDVHHTILPPTAALKPDVNQLWHKAMPLKEISGALTLAPIDMILHSATHLFHDGEMEHGLRDLVDIDSLLSQFAITESFWAELTGRAIELDLSRPLYYALYCCRYFLGTSIPDNALHLTNSCGKPSSPVAAYTTYILIRSIGSVFEFEKRPMTSLANFLVFVRSHYLRMPLHLLVPHLLRKMFISEKNRQ